MVNYAIVVDARL